MALKSSGCPEIICREAPVWQKKEFKSSVLKIVDSSRSLLPANSMCSDPADINHERKDTFKHLSSDAFAAKPMMELRPPAREMCISILLREGLLGTKSELSQKSAPNEIEGIHLFECKGCESMDDPFKMLICDDCGGAFHLSCCKPLVREIPEEKWYCQVCSRKKPKRQRKKLGPKNELPKPSQIPCRGLGAIQAMLLDADTYESEVRIGTDFQADVPEWSGPITGNEDEFVEPSELGPIETTMMDSLQLFKKSSVDNWLQCREVLETGVVCGKRRRAPRSAVQTSTWDCSCALVWDPIHADRAVPQELETEEVLKQLNFIKKEKKRLACKKRLGGKKRKCGKMGIHQKFLQTAEEDTNSNKEPPLS